jgi:Cu(I)/Ag(I) efflux system membrane fusion protein
MKKILFIIVVAAVAGTAGWFAARKNTGGPRATGNGERQVAYYQSPMHPWITSSKPGRCTICGMNLEPVYEGERGFAADEGVVMLGSNAIQAIHVQTELVTNRPLVRTLRVAGVINNNESGQRRLSAYADGRVERLLVNYVGAEVTAGQPLAVIYSPALLSAESEYLVVAKQSRAADASENLRKERARMIEAAAERLKRLGYSRAQIAALEKKQDADARTEILAPLTGTVVARNVYEGQYVKEGEVLFEIADFSTMWFQFDAYEKDLSWLKLGQPVEITTPALPGKVFSGAIQFIDPNFNDMTRSTRVRVELPNPAIEENGRRLLLQRMYADGLVRVETPAVLAVPRTAVLSAGVPVIYVEVGPGAYEQRRVKLGRTGDDYREVLEGVDAGERVVTTGNLLIDSQAQLNTISAGRAGATERMPGMSSATNAAPPGAATVGALSEEQRSVVRDFIQVTSDLGLALAGDSLPRYNELAPKVHALVPRLLTGLGDVRSLRPVLQKLEETGHLEANGSLAEARKSFLPFSMAAVDLARQLRSLEPFRTIKVFNCPMVNRAIPGAAKNGQWIQLEPPLRNPFFGAEMLECGTEVK